MSGIGGRPAARIALAMAMARTPARRRRARRGSLERPVNGRLYRGSFLVALAAAPDPRVQHHPAGALAGAAPAAELRRAGDATARDRALEALPGPRSRRRRDRCAPNSGSATSSRRTACPCRRTPGRSTCPASGDVRLQQPLGGRTGTVLRRDRRDGAPRRHRHRAGRERRRERHGRSGRARARLRTGRHPGRPARALRAHDRLSLHGRRLLRRARRAPLRRALAVPRRRDDQPRCDRGPRAAAHRDHR